MRGSTTTLTTDGASIRSSRRCKRIYISSDERLSSEITTPCRRCMGQHILAVVAFLREELSGMYSGRDREPVLSRLQDGHGYDEHQQRGGDIQVQDIEDIALGTADTSSTGKPRARYHGHIGNFVYKSAQAAQDDSKVTAVRPTRWPSPPSFA